MPVNRSPRLLTPRTPERAEQAAIVQLLRTVGSVVYTLGTVRKQGDHPGTMQTPGLPDLLCFLPRGVERRRLLWIEVKAADGCLSPPQGAFRDYCREADVTHIVGTLDVVVSWLREEGCLHQPNRLNKYM